MVVDEEVSPAFVVLGVYSVDYSVVEVSGGETEAIS